MHYNMRYPKDKTTANLVPRPNKAFPARKTRSQKPTPFDPDDLTRRLYAVLAEQKTQAERKHRRARAEAEGQTKQSPRTTDVKRSKDAVRDPAQDEAVQDKSVSKHRTTEGHGSSRPQKDSGGEKLHRVVSKTSTEGEDGRTATYRHVPQVAASQHTRTTTVEPLSSIALTHKLSKKAMKFHKDGPNASREMATVNESTAPSEQTKTLKRVQSQREKQYERNQFQHPSMLEAPAEVDEKQPRRAHRHTFESHLKTKGLDPEDDAAARRRSTGSMLGIVDAERMSLDAGAHMRAVRTHDSADGREHPSNAEEHRVDWTQSDEVAGQSKPVEAPMLRKLESKWTLRGRLGSFTKHGKDDKGLSPPAEGMIPEESPKSPKSGFFARFKR